MSSPSSGTPKIVIGSVAGSRPDSVTSLRKSGRSPSTSPYAGDRALLGGLDRIALPDQARAAGDLQPGGGRGGGGERHEGVHHVVVLLRQITALRKRRAARQWDVRVLRRPERPEPALLQRPAE